MKYLSSEPFSSAPSTKSYRDGWDRIFGKEPIIEEEPLIEHYCLWCRETVNGTAAALRAHDRNCVIALHEALARDQKLTL